MKEGKKGRGKEGGGKKVSLLILLIFFKKEPLAMLDWT